MRVRAFVRTLITASHGQHGHILPKKLNPGPFKEVDLAHPERGLRSRNIGRLSKRLLLADHFSHIRLMFYSTQVSPGQPISSSHTSEHSNGESLDKEYSNLASEPEEPKNGSRPFRSLQSLYLRPLKRRPSFGIPSCDLQLRSYSLRNLEFFSDFALRAAYYLRLPALGPVPLPRIVERWTVPRSNFIFKKSQENFERMTSRRLVQIQDGHPQAVDIWLAFLRKHQFHGVGMKANVWHFESLGQIRSSRKYGSF